jgi:hypothetical protein
MLGLAGLVEAGRSEPGVSAPGYKGARKQAAYG